MFEPPAAQANTLANYLAEHFSEDTLAIPPLEAGETAQDKHRYLLGRQHGDSKFLKGLNTSNFGISRDNLGPTLPLHEGHDVTLPVNNQPNNPLS